MYQNTSIGLKLIYLEWDDHCSPNHTDWRRIEYINNNPIPCASVGWIVKEDEHAITISAAKCDGGYVSNEQTIIKKCITKRRILRYK